MNTKEKLMDEIGFLGWADIPREFLDEWVYEAKDIVRCCISPDVHSLHIVWELQDGSKWHEIADYPYDDEPFTEWLGYEIGDDSYGEVDIPWDDLLNDYGKHVPKTLTSDWIKSV